MAAPSASIEEGEGAANRRASDLERERFEFERNKVERDFTVQLKRLAIERHRARREGKFTQNPALISAAISLGAVLVSASNILISFASGRMESARRHEETERQLSLDAFKLIYEHQADFYGQDEGKRKRAVQMAESVLSKEAAARVKAAIPQDAPRIAEKQLEPSVPAPREGENLVVTKVSGEEQAIPLGGWRSFFVRITDKDDHPVRGARVAWRMPDHGGFTYVGETDEHGISSATNMYTAGSPGEFQQTATVVSPDTPVGFTDVSKTQPIGGTVTFRFSQR